MTTKIISKNMSFSTSKKKKKLQQIIKIDQKPL